MALQQYLRFAFFFALLLGVLVLTFFIFQPYLLTLSTAAALAVIVQPLYKSFLRIVHEVAWLAALLTVITTILLVLAPLTLLGMKVGQEAASLYTLISERGQTLPSNFLDVIEQTVEQYVRAYVPSFDIDLQTVIRQALIWITSHLGSIFANTVETIFHFLLGTIAFYYLVKDGRNFIQILTDLSPLSDRYDRKIFDRLEIAVNSIVKGSLLIALLQGTVSGIGYLIFGLPSAALWGSATALGALVPGVGTAIVILPAVLYLFFTGHSLAALGLGIWGVVAVGLIDNFLGPILVGRGVRIHPLLVLFSVIGGIEFFGPLGIILGPIVLSLLYALLDIYKLIVKSHAS